MIKGLNYLLILFCLLLFSAGYPMDSQQKTWLLMMPQTSQNLINLLTINNNGNISTTAHSIDVGTVTGVNAINFLSYPTDQRFIWLYINDSTWKGLRQYEIQSDGILHETGRYFECGFYSGYIASTPDKNLLIVIGINSTTYIFKTYPDGSIETTANISDYINHMVYVSPRGDVLFTKGTTHIWTFNLVKVDYQTPSLTLLKEYDITEPLQVQPNVVFTPDGKNLVRYITIRRLTPKKTSKGV